jgi:PLP dependent protein
MIAENLDEVRNRIDQACERAGRDPKEVTLIAVSKTKPLPMLEEAYAHGVRDFGENWVQEIQEKVPLLPEDIHWHMIGHLQRNKVKYIIDKVSLIHSVDSVRLAEEIEKQAEKHHVEKDILVEVNMAEEETKFGLKKDEVIQMVRECAKLPHVHIKGLMTIAPFVENPEDNRQYFKAIRELSVDISRENIDNVSMGILSMGMTGDFEVAVEEGATLVRVGTGIFGERNYNK